MAGRPSWLSRCASLVRPLAHFAVLPLDFACAHGSLAWRCGRLRIGGGVHVLNGSFVLDFTVNHVTDGVYVLIKALFNSTFVVSLDARSKGSIGRAPQPRGP